MEHSAFHGASGWIFILPFALPAADIKGRGVIIPHGKTSSHYAMTNPPISGLTSQDLFHFDDDRENFDSIAKQNGFTFWMASSLMELLGYQSWSSFNKAIQKAISACTSSNIDIFENFVQASTIVDGKSKPDYKLSRFACYLVAMNADSKKPEVARAQAYFATVAEAFQRYIDEAAELERVLIRDEITEHEKTLSSTAKQAGVDRYGLFQNAGYRGLYNMNISQLRELKQIPKSRSPLDFMGKEELAANLFRVTQTEAKLKNDRVRGQHRAEATAESVGREVRDTMRRISGNTPESLPPSEDIKKVRTAIKASQRDFAKLDKKKD